MRRVLPTGSVLPLPLRPGIILWHYTSVEAWRKIEVEGLVPQSPRPDLGIPYPVTWCFRIRQEGLGLLGTTILHMAKTMTSEMAEIAVRLGKHDRKAPTGDYGYWTITHDGEHSATRSEKWIYHVREPSCLLFRRVPPTRLHLARTIALTEEIYDAR